VVPDGYIVCSGYALQDPKKGFIAFESDGGMPYIPKGGKKALKSILDAGGFVNFDGMRYIQPIKGDMQ
jgi:hypothetical protein